MVREMKRFKILAVFSAFAMFFAVASVVYGGLNWTGIDPVLHLPNGDIVNVDIAVPPRAWCHIDDEIKVRIVAPAGTTLIKETEGECGVTTKTRLIDRGDHQQVRVQVLISSDERRANRIPAQVMISQEGEELRTCDGRVNKKLNCRVKVDIDDDDDGDGDDDDDDD